MLPTIASADVGETLTKTGPEMVTRAVPDFDGFATDVALTVTCAGEGADVGAVKRPVVEIVPQAAPVQPAPLTLHVTAVLDAPFTVALNCWCAPTRTFAVAGETATTSGATTVTWAVADRVGSATDVAVTDTWGGLGTEDGAV